MKLRQRVADTSSDEVIVLSGLSKLYEPTPRWMRVMARSHIKEPVQALDGVDLVVRAGEICAIVGPNGAGKTTLFRIIVGLTTASSGSASVLGLDVGRDSERIRQVVGWMPSEDRSLLMRATCKENLQLHGRLQGMARHELAERIPHVLAAVNLIPQTETVVAGLSAGMKARLRLARALLPGPRALILDEPTGAVDPIAAHGLLNLIMDLVKQERLAVLISSHRLEEIEALQSQALLMDKGRVKYSGDLDDLRTEWETPLLELVFADAEVARQAAADLMAQGLDVTADASVVHCRMKVKGGVGAVLSGLGPLTAAVQHIREIPMPIRDLIAQVYAREGAAQGGKR
jgi:ABC-2 type transport system ATP-binding protein